MAERITLREFLAGTAVMTATGAERLLFSESLAGVAGNPGVSRETLAFGEYAAGLLETAGVSRETLRFAEGLRGAVVIAGVSAEALRFGERLRSDMAGISQEALTFGEYAAGRSLITGGSRESLAFSEQLRGALVETASGVVWVVNLKTGAHSRYTGDLTGATAVAASVVTAATDFGSPRQKHVYDSYLDMRVAGEMELATIVDEQRQIEGYAVEDDGMEGLHRRRCRLARGVRGNVWQFRINNVAGADFTLKGLEVLPVSSQRVTR